MREIAHSQDPPPDLRQLRALVAVVEARSFRRAAAQLGYAQSAVSHQIAMLEQALDVKLLDRPGGRHPVTPTSAGLRAADFARAAIESLERTAADMRALRGWEGGPLRVGVFQTAAAFLLPVAMPLFRRGHPDAQLVLHEEVSSVPLLESLRRGDLDLTFAANVSADDSSVEARDLILDRHVIVTWPLSPLAGGGPLPLAALHGVDMIAWQEGHGFHDAFVRALELNGIAPRIVYRTNDNLTLQRGVAAMLGHACIGELAARGLLTPDLTIVPLAFDAPPVRIQICWACGREQSGPARGLVDSLTAAWTGLRSGE
jgi:DNA-binding transcriptional LysR family regulator